MSSMGILLQVSTCRENTSCRKEYTEFHRKRLFLRGHCCNMFGRMAWFFIGLPVLARRQPRWYRLVSRTVRPIPRGTTQIQRLHMAAVEEQVFEGRPRDLLNSEEPLRLLVEHFMGKVRPGRWGWRIGARCREIHPSSAAFSPVSLLRLK